MTYRAPPCILDAVLDGFTIYRLLLVVTQRDVLYQKKMKVYEVRANTLHRLTQKHLNHVKGCVKRDRVRLTAPSRTFLFLY